MSMSGRWIFGLRIFLPKCMLSRGAIIWGEPLDHQERRRLEGKNCSVQDMRGVIANVMHPAAGQTLADLDLLEESLGVGRK
jgi:hypothetical protein